MPLDTQKRIVYVDQYLVSDIVKAKERRIDRPDLVIVFDLLNRGLNEEKLVCPTSWFHEEEGSLTSLNPEIQQCLRYMGQVDFLPPFRVEERQFTNAACAFLGKEQYYKGWELCLHDNPDQRLRRFVLDAHMNMAIFNFRQERQKFARALDAARTALTGRTFEEQLSLERRQVPEYLNAIYGFAVWPTFSSLPDGLRLYSDFLANSGLVASIPSADIFTQLCSALLIHHNHRPIRPSDHTDMRMLSTLLPYCHVITTDKFMKDVVCGMKLDARFGARVFSGKGVEIGALIGCLEEILTGTPPAHVPVLSLLVIPNADIKQHLWNFFREIMFVAGRWGEWVEIVNINEGDYPTYADRRSGVRMPDASFFFEFDREIRGAPGTLDYVAVARTLRGPATVIVDSHAPIGDDFIPTALAGLDAGETTVPGYGWRIVRTR